jgi:hypothetical protein
VIILGPKLFRLHYGTRAGTKSSGAGQLWDKRDPALPCAPLRTQLVRVVATCRLRDDGLSKGAYPQGIVIPVSSDGHATMGLAKGVYPQGIVILVSSDGHATMGLARGRIRKGSWS